MRTIYNKTMMTPSIKFDDKKNKLSVEGNIILCDGKDFWKDITKEIVENSNIKIVDFEIEHINTDSIRNLLIMLNNNKTTFEINWLYEDYDDDMRELGESIERFTNKKINLIEK